MYPSAAQCSTLKMNCSILAATSAPFLAFISDSCIHIIAGGLCLVKCHPHRLPKSFSILSSPGRRRRKLGFFFKYWLHTNPYWYTARSTCGRSISDVGGMLSIDLFPLKTVFLLLHSLLHWDSSVDTSVQ